MAWGPIAMMANIGGISTSPALASAYNKKLMPYRSGSSHCEYGNRDLLGFSDYFFDRITALVYGL